LPRLRVKREYLERLASQAKKGKRAAMARRERESNPGPKVFPRICARCQVTRPHTITELGHYKCKACGTESMERFTRLSG